jgi:SAM-dependent methyltransferase
LAADYDRTFTATVLGGRYRAAVWRRLEARWSAGDRVLELNCGTGEDAVHLARRGVAVMATDISSAMVAATRRKADEAGVGPLVETATLAIEDLGREASALGRFDGALSNFGGLNCVPDLAAAGIDLAGVLRPGASAILCVMGPLVPWEWAWFTMRGEPKRALRRLRRQPEWRGLSLHYPSPGRLRRAFAPAFQPERTAALGVFLPPPYAETLALRHPAAVDRLDRLERRVERLPGLAYLSDHYLVELVRR